MKVKGKLTKTHQEIYDYILYFAKKKNALPTVNEISDGTGYNRNTVTTALHRMEFCGMIKFRKTRQIKMYSVTKLKYVEVKDSEV